MSYSSHYRIPSYTQQFELEIKRSRLITTVAYANSRDDAKQCIQDRREEYPDARHHCWAFIVGSPSDLHGVDQSDDGEPKDTAGKPILNVLQHSGLGNTVVVVSRYFGGIKLGAGGLVRAYSQSASQALQAVVTQDYIVRKTLTISLPYSLMGKVEYWLQSNDITIEDKQFNHDIHLSIGVPLSYLHQGSDDQKPHHHEHERQSNSFQQQLDQLGNGNIVLLDHSDDVSQ